jgi:hypothetical protein
MDESVAAPAFKSCVSNQAFGQLADVALTEHDSLNTGNFARFLPAFSHKTLRKVVTM